MVDAVKQEQKLVFVQVFIDGLSAALPLTVVVDEQDAAGGQSRIQMNQFLASGFVPIGIQA